VSDGVRLPRLTREELAALSDRPVLSDAEDHAWWEGLDHARREEVATAAWRGLMARDLVRQTGEGVQVDGRLKFITGVRSAPVWLAVASAETRLIAHGVDLPEGPFMLLEHRPVPGVGNFVGMKASPGVDAIVAFLLRSPAADEDLATRRLEVLHPEPEPDTQRRMLVVGHREARIAPVSADGVAGEPVPTDPVALRADLLELIKR
jgi:hypothetical protein